MLTNLNWGIVLISVITVALTCYAFTRQRPLAPVEDASPGPGSAPLVSILLPVRNEEHRVLRQCLLSLLAQNYESFEIIAVNDRSTDRSGEILAKVASASARMRVIEGTEPPTGWLGKPHAMRQALAGARGSWVLLTDADVIFDESALRTAMAHVAAQNSDALTLIPHFESRSFWERVAIPAWSWVLLMVFLLYRVNNPRSPGALGIGGFFLIRRAALKRIGDFDSVKDEVAEDFRVAVMLKRSGARLRIEYAPQLLRTRMYSNFAEMWECHSKNWFAGANYSLVLALASVVGTYLVGVVPPLIALACAVGMAAGVTADLWPLLLPAALVWALQVLIIALVNRRLKVPLIYALLSPLGLALLYALLLDSSLRITMGRGVRWKGRRIYERAGVRPPRIKTRVAPAAEGDEELE